MSCQTGAHRIASEEERLFLVQQVDRTLDRLALGSGRQMSRDAVTCLGVLAEGAAHDTKEAMADIIIRLLQPNTHAKG